MTTHIRHNEGVSDKVLIEDFSKRKFQQEKYLKPLTQKRLNKESLDYFENYRKHVIDPKYFFLTIRFDIKIMSYLPSRRLDFVEKVYEEIKHRMYTKVGIKNYKRIKPHFDKYEYLHRIRSSRSDPDMEMIQILIIISSALCIQRIIKINRRFGRVWWTLRTLSYFEADTSFSYYDAIHSLHVQEIKSQSL